MGNEAAKLREKEAKPVATTQVRNTQTSTTSTPPSTKRYTMQDLERYAFETVEAPIHLVRGRYRVKERLGNGAFGKVFKVRDEIDDELKALKIIKITKEEDYAKFEQEVKLIASVDHSNVVKYYESFLLKYDPDPEVIAQGQKNTTAASPQEKPLFACMIMEYVDGMSLAKLIEHFQSKQTKIPMFVIVKCFIDLLDALEKIHEKNICHRDIKVFF